MSTSIPSRAVSLCAAVSLLLLPLSARAQTVVNWTGSSGDWTDPSKWTPAADPNGNFDARLNLSTTVTLNVNRSITHWTQSTGTVTGTGNLTVTGTSAWSGGAMSGTGTTNFNGGTTISGDNNNKSINDGRTVNFAGTTTWTNTGPDNGAISTGGASSVLNNNGTWLDQNVFATAINDFSNGSGSSFNNVGTYTKSGAGTTTMNIAFNSTGTVNIDAGTLVLARSGTSDGAFHGSGTLRLQGGSVTFSAASNVDVANVVSAGFGTTTFAGSYGVATTTLNFGTVAFSGASPATTTTLALNGGTLAGAQTFNVSGPTTWTAGGMSGTGTTNLNGGTTITGDGNKGINDGHTVNFAGTTTWSNTTPGNGAITISGNGVSSILNNNGSWLDQNAFATAINDFSNGSGFSFNNAGTYAKSGAGATTFNIGLNNTGTIDVQAGNLTLARGVAQHSGTTLTGGTWIVRDNAALTINTLGAQNITTNQGDVTLRGTNSSFARIDTLVNNQGAFRLLDNRSFNAVGAFTNSGTLQIGGGTFTAPALTNTATGEINGFGSVAVRPTNNGVIRAAGGTLALNDGIAAGATVGNRVQVDAGATLNVSGGSSGSRADLLVVNGALNVGANTFVVGKDYTNASFGSGNSFNARANITGTGPINAAGDVAQAITGAQVSNGTTASATLALGNVRVGDSVTRNFAIVNTGTTGADLRGAIQTAVNGGNITDARLSGSCVTAGNFGPLATGTNQAMQVTFNATSAGALNGQQVHVANNFDNVGDQTLALTGAAYRVAQAALGQLNFGNVLVGSSQTRFLSVTNSALADGFSEGLNASFGSFSGPSAGLLSSSGSITNLAAGASNNTTLAITLNTSAAGTVTASVQVLLGSNGNGTSGLGVLSLPAQNVPIDGLIQANVGNLAAPSAAAPNPVNLGNVRVGAASPTQALTISNTQVGPAEALNASISTASPGLTATGSFTNLAPGATNSSSLVVGMNTATAGSRNGTATIALASDGSFNNGVATPLGSQTVGINGAVYQPAVAGTLPSTLNLGTMRAGTVVNTALNISNTAPQTGGFTETLGATFGTVSPGLVGNGNVSGLTAGTSSSAMGIQFTAGAPGTFNGSAQVNFLSQEINGSGLGNLALTGQSANFTASINAVASLGIATLSAFTFTPTGPTSGELDFGAFSAPGSFLASMRISDAVTGPADSLVGAFDLSGLAGTPFSVSVAAGNFTVGPGGALTFQVQFAPTADGTFATTLTMPLASHNAFQDDLSLGTYSLTFRGQVGGVTPPAGAVPDSPIGLLGAATLLGTLALGHRYQGKLSR